MRTKIFLAIFAIAIVANSVCSCSDFTRIEEMTVDSVKVEKGYQRLATLYHSWDSAMQTRVVDNMISSMTIKQLRDSVKVIVFQQTFHPKMEASSIVLKDDYTVSAELLNSAVVKSYLHRAIDIDGSELDTVYVELADGQKIWYPVKITNKSAKVGSMNYNFGSLTLLKAIYRGAKNVVLEKSIAGNVYKTSYQTTLFLKEANLNDPKTFEVQVYAFAKRTVPSDKPKSEFTVTVKDRNRTPIDALSERLRFTKVFTYASGNVSNVEISIVLNRSFAGRNFTCQTHDFDYKRTGSNGISEGKEALIEQKGNWSVYGKTDTYSAPFENGVAMDALNSHYDLYHQRATYEDEHIKVEFGYEAIRVIEVKTEVVKQSNVTAILKNRINTVYLGFGQDLENNISLYR